MSFLDNWLLVAFLAPMFWAFVNLIDVYFVEEVYENEYDGTVIMGVAQIIPWLAVPIIGLIIPDIKIIIYAMLGGFFLLVSYFFYFKTLFTTSDVTLIQILWNIVAITVPVMAFLFLGERLSMTHYIGIAVTLSGALLISFDKKIGFKKDISKVLIYMSGAVFFMSLSMIFAKNVYSNTSFQGGIMFFSLGSIIAGLFFYILRLKKHGKGELVKIGKKYYMWFLLAEFLTLAGIITSQRAIDISPSVSFVAVIESIMPAFVVFSSAVVFLFLSFISHKKKDVAKKIYNDQLMGISSKIFAIIIMAIGIFMLNL